MTIETIEPTKQVEGWAGQEHCQAIVSMSGRDMKYSLSVNGQELGTCKNGLNVIEWKYKGD